VETRKKLMFRLCVLFIFTMISSFALADNEMLIEVDPPDRLMNSFVVGEWATEGNLDGWTGSSISGLTATGGAITGTGTGASPYIQRLNLAGPDLDFGYYDYLQIRLKVPASFNDDIIFRFGTSTHDGVTSTSREFRITSSEIVTDGNYHSYRLDLGLVIWWRDSLDDLRIYPLGNSGSGLTFYIDYVEVGDLPGDVLLVNTNVNFFTGETIADCSRMESKHGTFWWSPQSYVEFSDFNPTVMGRRALRMLEESYQVYTKKLGFIEPTESIDLWRRDGNRYKTNHTTWWGGFWMGGHYDGFGYFNVPGYGLGDEGWGNPLPHEYGHVFDMHQINFLTGGHWESHANHYQNNRDMHFDGPLGSHPTNIGITPFEFSGFRQDHGRLIYADYRIHQALQDYADDLGLDPYIAAKLWYEGVKEKTVYDKLSDILPGGYNVPDVVTFGLRHWPFLDFPDGPKMATELWSSTNNKAWWYYITGSLLIPCQDKPGWWRSPFERSPEKFAYMYHELVPTDGTVTVELQGFDLLGSTEGWRWSLAAMHTSGAVRYSDVWSPGTHSFTLNPGETKVYLIVVATPTDNSLNLGGLDNRYPVDKHPDRLHYPYEVRIVGATPAKRQLQWAKGAGAYLPSNQGGGWKDNSAYVASAAWVGPNAMVLGSARVEGYGRVEDYAVIMGNAKVQDYATVSGYAVLRDGAIARNYARVRDRAALADSTIAGENAVVEDYAHLIGSTIIQGSAIARGVTFPWEGTFSGTAILSYDYSYVGTLSDGVHFSHVPWGDWYIPYWWETKAKPRGLVASYRTEESDGQIWWDEFGDQHALLRGDPTRPTDANMNSPVLRLNGTSQYAVLDRSICDFAAGSFGIWVKPNGSNTNKPVLFMGASASKYLKLVARNGSGKAEFTITDGTITKTITSTSTIPVDAWTHLAVTLDGSSIKLYVNGGAPEATTSTTLVPQNCLGANDYTVSEGFYIGRDYSGSLFAGDIEDARFYNVALTVDEIANEKRRSGDVIGVFYYNSPQDFDGSATEAQSGVHNGLERVLEASIYPDTSDDVGYYEAVLDCTDESDGSFEGTGFGLDNGEIIVRLENVGFWRTGIYVTLGQWQKITVGFNGGFAELYVDDVLKASRTYTATQNDVAGKNYRIGFAMDTGSNKYYFDGRIKDIFISVRFNIGDSEPPLPNPAAFDQSPVAVSSTEITMTAAAGTDASGVVEYYFDETSGNPGGSDSGWQNEATYNDTGLEHGYEYSYTVKMRDKYGNETDVSAEGKAITPEPGDFNNDGVVDANDLEIFMLDWLVEYVPVNPGLVGLWAFDEQSGTTAHDSAGGNDGTIYGGATLNGSGILTFDGIDDYVDVNPTICDTRTVTIALWINYHGDTPYWANSLFHCDGWESGDVHFMILDEGGIRFALNGNAANDQDSVFAFLPEEYNKWHHVAVVYDADAMTVDFYIDGVLDIQRTYGATRSAVIGPLTIGSWNGTDRFLDGSLDDLRIYNYCLEPAEIESLYNGIPPGTSKETDMYFDGIINFKDFAIYAQNWLMGYSN